MCCLRFGSVLLDFDCAEGDDFLRWRKMPRRTWSGGVVAADILKVKRGGGTRREKAEVSYLQNYKDMLKYHNILFKNKGNITVLLLLPYLIQSHIPSTARLLHRALL